MTGTRPSSLPDYHFYGRRKGRALSTHMKQLLSKELPRLSLDKAALSSAPLASQFDSDKDALFLEIGFGGGEHLAQLAAGNPHAGFIGAEPFINGVASLVRQIDEHALSNIRIWSDDVRPLLDVMERGCLDGVYVMFPDPWPKRRHAYRRILSQKMLDSLAGLVAPGGFLRMASDHPIAKTWLLAEAMRHPAFDWRAETAADWRTRPENWPETRYMAKGTREGRASSWFDFARLKGV